MVVVQVNRGVAPRQGTSSVFAYRCPACVSPRNGPARSPEELAKEFEPTAQSIRTWVAQADADEGRSDGLTIDEKTAIAARSRKHPDIPAAPGRPTRREFEYKRHGTASLMAALNIATGQALGEIITRNDADTFIGFLTMLDQHIAPDRPIHVVLDNGSSHTAKKTKAWLADNRAGTSTGPRHTPPGSTRSSSTSLPWPKP